MGDSSKSKRARPPVTVNGVSFAVSQRIDAQDHLGNWYPAKILEVNNTKRQAYVHFEKWNKCVIALWPACIPPFPWPAPPDALRLLLSVPFATRALRSFR